MIGPPSSERRGAVDAPTPTTPERVSSAEDGNKDSRRTYVLRPEGVNPALPVADARESGRGTGNPDELTDAERKFLEICVERTGEELPADLHAQRLRYRELLFQQSHRIAETLEAQGIRAHGKAKLTLVGICSGEMKEIPDFRNVVFIPAVAQRKRNAILKHLELFLQHHSASRMWVFTSGERVRLSNVRERMQDLHRRLSKLNAEPFMKAAGVSLVFRSTELGEVERPDQGEPTFHVHAHTIVQLARKLPKDEWSGLLAQVRAFWVHHFSDSKRIHQARETCKYVVKPADLEKLTGPELAALYHQTFRLHLVQSLGLLREQQNQIKDGRKRIVRRGKGPASRWEVVDAWDPLRSRKKVDESTSGDETEENGETEEEEDDEENDLELMNFGPLEDWILCTLPPSFALSAKAEPVAVVLNMTGERLGRNRKLNAIREFCADRFAKGPSKADADGAAAP